MINDNKSRLKKGLYYGANTLLPLSETSTLLKTIGRSLVKQCQKANPAPLFHWLRARKEIEPELSFEEALKASHCTIDELTQRFLNKKRLCLAFIIPLFLFFVALVSAIIINGHVNMLFLAKATSYLLAISALIAVLFVQAMIASWRLWQLKHRRATEIDQGTFLDFKKTDYIRQTLNFFR